MISSLFVSSIFILAQTQSFQATYQFLTFYQITFFINLLLQSQCQMLNVKFQFIKFIQIILFTLDMSQSYSVSDLLRELPGATTDITRRLSLVHFLYAKYRQLKDQITNKQIQFILTNEGIANDELEPNAEAYLRQYNTILDQAKRGEALNLQISDSLHLIMELIEKTEKKIKKLEKGGKKSYVDQEQSDDLEKKEANTNQMNEYERVEEKTKKYIKNKKRRDQGLRKKDFRNHHSRASRVSRRNRSKHRDISSSRTNTRLSAGENSGSRVLRTLKKQKELSKQKKRERSTSYKKK